MNAPFVTKLCHKTYLWQVFCCLLQSPLKSVGDTFVFNGIKVKEDSIYSLLLYSSINHTWHQDRNYSRLVLNDSRLAWSDLEKSFHSNLYLNQNLPWESLSEHQIIWTSLELCITHLTDFGKFQKRLHASALSARLEMGRCNLKFTLRGTSIMVRHW